MESFEMLDKNGKPIPVEDGSLCTQLGLVPLGINEIGDLTPIHCHEDGHVKLSQKDIALIAEKVIELLKKER